MSPGVRRGLGYMVRETPSQKKKLVREKGDGAQSSQWSGLGDLTWSSVAVSSHSCRKPERFLFLFSWN
jgi:hypothetical protein